MTGYRYAKWRSQPKHGVPVTTFLIVACTLALLSAVKMGVNAPPAAPIPQELYDHPLLFLCIIVLLCLLCAVLFLSRRKLQISERRYRSLFMDNGAVMFLVDLETLQILDVNPAACAFYGWSPAEFLSKRITDINTLPEAEVRELYRDVLHFERRRFSARHRLASGEERNLEVNSMPYRVDGRECLFSIVHDVTTSGKGAGRTT